VPVIADPALVDAIDVVTVDLDDGWAGWTTVPGRVIATWDGERVAAVLDLVAALPESTQMRCFLPRYAIRLRRGARIVAEVAFCFRCRNALGIGSAESPQTPGWFTFDPDSPPARQLKRLFQLCHDDE
jgi:hypothetical protein